MKNPCYHCEERVAGCHGDCERYIAWLENKQKIAKDRLCDIQILGYEIKRFNKIEKYRHQRGKKR